MGIPFETEPGFWECPYQLFESGGPVEIKTAAGVDAFQAIVQALDHISVELAAKAATTALTPTATAARDRAGTNSR